jgi:hypothetical protein
VIRFIKRLWLQFRIAEVESQRETADARCEQDHITVKQRDQEFDRINRELAELRKKLESL